VQAYVEKGVPDADHVSADQQGDDDQQAHE
jgi:hypothetical protein